MNPACRDARGIPQKLKHRGQGMTGFGFGQRARTLAAVGKIAEHAGKLGIEICDVSGHVEVVAARATRQTDLCHGLQRSATSTVEGNQKIAAAARQMRIVADQAASDVSQSQETVRVSLADIHSLVDSDTLTVSWDRS